MVKNKSNYSHTNYSATDQYTMEAVAGQPVTMTKRIGSTNYRVHVHFSETSSETLDDKIIRLVKNEAVSE